MRADIRVLLSDFLISCGLRCIKDLELGGIKSIVWLFFAYACIELKNDYRQVSSFKVS